MKSFFSIIPLLVSAAFAAPAVDLVSRDTVSVHFTDTAKTYYGENIYIVGSINELGNWSPDSATLLSAANYPDWDVTLNLPSDTTFQYKFFRKQSDGSIIWELDPNRQYTTGSSGSESSTSTFNGAAGTSNGEEATNFVQGDFSVTATTYYGENIYLIGSIGALGAWNPSQAILMSSADYPTWRITVSLPANTEFQFKFIRKGSDGSITWENDPNREDTTPSSGTFFFKATFNGVATTSTAATTASTITASTSTSVSATTTSTTTGTVTTLSTPITSTITTPVVTTITTPVVSTITTPVVSTITSGTNTITTTITTPVVTTITTPVITTITTPVVTTITTTTVIPTTTTTTTTTTTPATTPTSTTTTTPATTPTSTTSTTTTTTTTTTPVITTTPTTSSTTTTTSTVTSV